MVSKICLNKVVKKKKKRLPASELNIKHSGRLTISRTEFSLTVAPQSGTLYCFIGNNNLGNVKRKHFTIPGQFFWVLLYILDFKLKVVSKRKESSGRPHR